jgi:UDP-glucuronate 4-epimerase
MSAAPGTVLVTGAAGFIGSFVAARLAALGWNVIACDNFNAYYLPRLKHERVAALLAPHGVGCRTVELADPVQAERLFRSTLPSHVVHLAAQAGVRHSIEQPQAYVESNLVAFANILELCRRYRPQHLVYASSSSVYGDSGKLPFQEDDRCDAPLSFYAATKKANELMAHSYSHLFGLAATGLRFFTVYGPWGRPDMAYFHFAEKMCKGEPIPVYAHGALQRDFTWIGDVAEAVVRVLDQPGQPGAGGTPHPVLNVGSGRPVALGEFIATLEQVLGVKAVTRMLPMQPGDVTATWADVSRLHQLTGFTPTTTLADGLSAFAKWFLQWNK